MGYEIACSSVSMAEPLSYAEAMRCPDAEQWKQAALKELNVHSTNGTWKLVPRHTDKKVIGSKWVFKVKRNTDSSIERYKGRLVATIYIYAKADVRVILPVFVDDMTFASKSAAAIDQLILELSQHFKLQDLGATTQLLGIKIDRDRSKRSITISQHQYCLDILERFGMADCKPISTPMQCH